MFKRIVIGITSAALVFVASSGPAYALISNNSCSSGKAKSSGCQGGNEVGGDPKLDASCCSKAIAAPPRDGGRTPTALPTSRPRPQPTSRN